MTAVYESIGAVVWFLVAFGVGFVGAAYAIIKRGKGEWSTGVALAAVVACMGVYVLMALLSVTYG